MTREVSTVNTEQDEMLDKLLEGKTSEQILGQHGSIKQMTQRIVERALATELGPSGLQPARARREHARQRAQWR